MQKQEPEESGDWSDGSGWKRTSVTVQRFSHAPARPTSPAESRARDSEPRPRSDYRDESAAVNTFLHASASTARRGCRARAGGAAREARASGLLGGRVRRTRT